MDNQTIINVALGSVIAVAGWFARVLWDAVESMKADIHELEVHLPTNYIRRDEFHEGVRELKDLLNRDIKELKALLNKISDKLENKADKN